MTKNWQSERDEFIAKLRETLNPGDTLHTVLRSVSRTGMSRVIDVYHFRCIDGKMDKSWLSYWIAKACDMTFQNQRGKPEGIKIGGCGSDMGFEIVYNLGRTLYPDGVPCAGDKCLSNDHTNARYSSAYCMMCGCEIPLLKRPSYNRSHGERSYPVCSQACASAPWIHRDGGYAFKQEWL